MQSGIENINNTGNPFPVAVPPIGERYNVNLPIDNPAGKIALAILDSDYLIDLELSAAQAEERAENALFSALCAQSKITFIGPPPGAVRLFGDKARARETMKGAGLDPIPGTEGTVDGLEAARSAAEEIGYPVLLKASAGGGGKGMRIVNTRNDLENAFNEASLEAEKAFANPSLYMEKYISRGRHIEFQILADVFGNAVHLGERECSIQRKHQKLFEEAPSPALNAEGPPNRPDRTETRWFVLPDEPHRHAYRHRHSPMAGRGEGAATDHDHSLAQLAR